MKKRGDIILFLLRLSLGWTFLWGFFDKLLGLGFSTCRDEATNLVSHLCDAAWINGGSPTFGFLKFGVTGPLTNFFNSIAGNPIVDWLFMIGLLGIGIGLITGITMKLASYGGTVMVLLMWLASLPTAHGVFMDEHVIYALVLLILVWTKTEDKIWSLSKWWKELRLVKKHKWLE